MRRAGTHVALHDSVEHEEVTPEEHLVAARLMRGLSRRISDLPEPQRAVFVLARFEGLDYSEIADLLGTPIGTVKNGAVGERVSGGNSGTRRSRRHWPPGDV